MKKSKLSKLSLVMFCAFMMATGRGISADTENGATDKTEAGTKISDTAYVSSVDTKSENDIDFSKEDSDELFSTDVAKDTNVSEPTETSHEAKNEQTEETDKVKLEDESEESVNSASKVDEETAESGENNDVNNEEQVSDEKITGSSNEGTENDSTASGTLDTAEETNLSTDEDTEANKEESTEADDAKGEVKEADSNVVAADSMGLSDSNGRGKREAGGWKNIDGAVYYIDPGTGQKVTDGVHFIDSVPYLFNEKGQLIKGWYTNSKGEKSFAKNDGVAYRLGAYTLSDGLRYVIDERGVIAKDRWVDEPGYGRAYGRPSDGVAYQLGAYTVKDGIRYVFNSYGYLAKNQWVDEPGYGRAYGRPGDGAAYKRGAYTVKDGIRYVFNNYGYLAKDEWVDEPGYGRAYGRPSDGAAYKLGAFTVKDGVRYVFNNYGYLAKGYWVDEPGYGRVYGRPSDGAAYKSGAFTISDGIRYVFNDYGYLAKGEWVEEPGYGRAYGDPKTGSAYINGIYTISDGLDYVFDSYGYAADGKWLFFPNKGYAYAMPKTGQAYKNGIYLVDGKKYVFNEKGYANEGWYFIDDRGFCFGLGQKGELVVNKKIKMNNRIYQMDANGFWSERKQLTADDLNNLDYQEKDNKLYLMVNGNKLDTSANINGKMIYVKPGTYEIASPLGWHWFGDKEFYFTDKVSIAKPYQKVGNAYVNGAYGPRIYAEAKGIDVSSHNGDIDWKKVKSDDVDFAFIRASYTTNTDFKFEKNMNAAKQAGVKTGIYIYSMAKNKQDAVKEADYIINLMKKYNIDLPVAFDIEDPEVLSGTSSNRERTDIIHAFADKIQKAGYKVAVYSNLNWLNNYLIKSELTSKYDIWLAHWHSKPGLTSKYWQASETGKVEGINTNVDIDFAFSKLP